MSLHPWLRDNLVCPVSRNPLTWTGEVLQSPEAREYPVVRGVPVLLVPEARQTHSAAASSWEAAHADYNEEDLFLETVGISDEERQLALNLHRSGDSKVDPVVSVLVGATSGYAYKHLIGDLKRYPVPEIPVGTASGDELLLDVGCGWGRWSVAASRKGYRAVGIDPSLGAVLAAKRVARELGETALFVVGDSRFLPFRESAFDRVFSYSVFQHLSRLDMEESVSEISRVLVDGGRSTVQMANRAGAWNFVRRLRRGFTAPSGFDVRYWSIEQIESVFRRIGPTTVGADCFFGLGLREADRNFMPRHLQAVVDVSSWLTRASDRLPLLRRLADSVLVRSFAS